MQRGGAVCDGLGARLQLKEETIDGGGQGRAGQGRAGQTVKWNRVNVGYTVHYFF